MRASFITAALFLLGLPLSTVYGQNLLANPGFEEGDTQPLAWRLSGGSGEWSNQAHSGKRAVMVAGDGKNSSFWRTERLDLKPAGLYRLSFYARLESGASGGCAIAGLSRVNRDFRLSDSWQRYSFVFSVPDDGTNDFLRLGQWEVRGKVFFDDVELNPVLVSSGGWRGGYGEAESLEQDTYRFRPDYAWTGANYHRPLWRNHAAFNSDRWIFSPGSELIYQFAHGRGAKNGEVSVNITYHNSGSLLVQASADASNWEPVMTLDGKHRSGATNLPAKLFPAQKIFVRLSMPGTEGNLQVNALSYQAEVDRAVTKGIGSTAFIDVLQSNPKLDVRIMSAGLDASQRRAQCLFVVSGDARYQPLRAVATNCPPCMEQDFTFSGSASTNMNLMACAQIPQVGAQPIFWRIHNEPNQTLFLGRSEVNLGFLYDPRPGYYLASTHTVDAWWCESGWKIGQDVLMPSPAPNTKIAPLAVSAARGEYESAQLILRPPYGAERLTNLSNLPFKNAQGDTAAVTLQAHELAYVNVTHPTDNTAQRDWYPDPLPPLTLPLALKRGKNTALWLTFQIPRQCQPGDYTSELDLTTSGGRLKIPLSVHVYDFELPVETHLRSALGLGRNEINRYHGLTNPDDRKAVYEKYLQNFAEHRISPYSFFEYAPIDIRFTGPKTNRQAQVDFAKFDAAASKWLDQLHLNSFLLPLRGMGGGTFQSRSLGELEGFKEGTPEFARLFKDYLTQIEQHLRERGWLDKAYTYWFDEPDRKDFEFVAEGMKRIKAAAPGLRRLLTKEPNPELLGHVEIWCGLTPEWTPQKVAERRKAGEEVWWYICCGPKAPYVTEFIDHPGTELRLWPWQSWQYGVQGILIWETAYWSSSSAFPGNKMQDPWTDPMSYVSGYDFGPGHIGYWGNGDGRFLYPPRRAPDTSQVVLVEPINSFRWENLREGMEDYEYFWLLRQAVERKEKAEGQTALTREARALLTIPETISKDLTHFTTDPRLLLEHRDKIARMIERLQGTK